MMDPRRSKLLPLLPWLAVAACDAPIPQHQPDFPVEADLRGPPGDMAGKACALPNDNRLIGEVSAGKVEVTTQPGPPPLHSAAVDGTAGGSMAFQGKPFLYIDLIGARKVDITDVQAQTSRDWDIAVKRWQIKINSGDSGPGGVTVARVDAADLAGVTAAPAGGYVADEYVAEDCTTALDPIGGLGTALSDWYDYNMTRLSPKKEVYVLKRRDGAGAVKLQILGYYSMAGTSASYTLRWSFLP